MDRPSSVLLDAVSSALVRSPARICGLDARMNRYRDREEVGAGRGSVAVPRRGTGQPGEIGGRTPGRIHMGSEVNSHFPSPVPW